MTTPTAGPAGEPALVLDALVRRFGSVTAVDGLSMGVARGSLVALLGPNGAGKTSTLDVCTGFARPDGGSVRVLGLDPWRRSRALRPRIGVMLQAGGAHAAARPGRGGPHPGAPAVRRAGAAAEPGHGDRRPAGAAVPGRAHRRNGPAGQAPGVGPAAGDHVEHLAGPGGGV